MTTFIDELQTRLESTPIEACKDIDDTPPKEGETILGEMPVLARRFYEIAEGYMREAKKIKATYLRVEAAGLESGTEKEASRELDSLNNLWNLFGRKADIAKNIMWVEIHVALDHLLPKDSGGLALRKGNLVVAYKTGQGFPFPFFLGEKP